MRQTVNSPIMSLFLRYGSFKPYRKKNYRELKQFKNHEERLACDNWPTICNIVKLPARLGQATISDHIHT